MRGWLRSAPSRTWVRHLALFLAYEVAGIAATWPLFTFIFDHKLLATQDTGGFVWGLWWVAHHLLSPGQLFYTTSLAAPVGASLGFSTMMPLAGLVMAPITLTAGPGASLAVLSVIAPGLLCYAMYRAARLWLNAPGAIAAGAFFGLSSTLAWRDWYHINVALGTVFLPLALEAAIRYRRVHGVRQAVWLGLVLGLCVMVNQQSFAIATVIAAVITLPWLIRLLIFSRAENWPVLRRLGAGLAALVVVGGVQFLAMLQQQLSGGARPPIGLLAQNWVDYGASLPTLFGPSPSLADHGLGALASSYNFNQPLEGLPTYGIVLTVIAVLGIVAGWRYRATWWFLFLWLLGSVLALGTSIVVSTGNCWFSAMYQGVQSGPNCRQYLPFAGYLHYVLVKIPHGPAELRPVVVSNLMPYSWMVRLPILSGLREANRLMFVGLIGAAFLAGLVVQWLSKRRVTRPLIAAVVVAGALEAGWAGTGALTMPTQIPKVGQFLANDHSNSIVVDVPFGLRGGLPLVGQRLDPWELVTATADGHPRAISYTAWVPGSTISAFEQHPFYGLLLQIQQSGGTPFSKLTQAQIQAARADYRKMGIGWVVEWKGALPGGNNAVATTTDWPGYLTHDNYWYRNIAAYFRAIGLRPARVICVAGPKTGCALPDQVWLWNLAR